MNIVVHIGDSIQEQQKKLIRVETSKTNHVDSKQQPYPKFPLKDYLYVSKIKSSKTIPTNVLHTKKVI